MIAKKEKQFLVFTFEDSKEVKYDLSTGKTYGKSGREVKSIASQLRGYSINDLINSFPDENYRRFLTFLNSQFVNRIINARGTWGHTYTTGCKVSNIGTFLSKIKNYRFFEQYFSAGVRNVDRELAIQISELPKNYLKWAKKSKEVVSNLSIKKYEKYSNEYGEIERIGDNYEILNRDSLEAIFIPSVYLSYNSETGRNDLLKEHTDSWRINKTNQCFSTLIKIYGYNKMSLLQYLDNIMYYEGVEPLSTLLEELVDYNKMQSEMSTHKYEKYPKNFLTTHTITCRNYNRLTKEYPVEDFKERVNKDLEFKFKDYIFIYPETPQDIKDEAVMQNNCVASYIEKVMNGSCHIMFLRKKNEPKKSLVTLEIKDYVVVQNRRAFNTEPSQEELEAIKEFNKFLNKVKKKIFQQKLKANEKFINATYIAPQKMVKRVG